MTRSVPPDAGHQRLVGILCLAVTVFGWALNWSSIKVLLQVWPPLFSRGLAGVAAAAALMALAGLRGERLRVPTAAVGMLGLLAARRCTV